jgi:hypothetical protein
MDIVMDSRQARRDTSLRTSRHDRAPIDRRRFVGPHKLNICEKEAVSIDLSDLDC